MTAVSSQNLPHVASCHAVECNWLTIAQSLVRIVEVCKCEESCSFLERSIAWFKSRLLVQ